jgi:hypothetical protein
VRRDRKRWRVKVRGTRFGVCEIPVVFACFNIFIPLFAFFFFIRFVFGLQGK